MSADTLTPPQMAEGDMTDALLLHVAAQDGQLADLRESCCALAQENVALAADVAALESLDTARVACISELKSRLASAAHEVELLYLGAAMDLARHTERFNAIVRLRDQLDTQGARATVTTDTRRTAAGATA